jgi:hypothetical protein
LTTHETEYSDDEWGLLVGLPESVAVAASNAESDGSRATHAEGQAGLEAISLGRENASPLVARVATELAGRVGDPETGEEAPMIRLPDPQAGIADVLQRARTACGLLDAREHEDDANAYKHWLVGIAEDVVQAARSGGVLGIGGERVSQSERQFVDELSAVLRD